MIRIAGYPMDLALSEEHSFPGEVTSYPVEGGPDISDHIRDLPEEITLECIVSDSPIGDIATDPTRQVADPNAPLPSADALAKLRELKAARRPVSVETSLGVFESMAIIDLNVPVDATRSPGSTERGVDGQVLGQQQGALFFTITLRKIVTVTNRRTRIRVKTDLAGAGGKPRPKVVVGTTVQVVDATVVWRHGTPPGAPFVGGLSEIVEVSYNKPAGLTREESIALGPASVSSRFVTYFRRGSPTPIQGAERDALLQDLARDAAEKRAAQGEALRIGPIEAGRQAQNLPPGVDLSRFSRPAPPTFPAGTFPSAPFNGVP